MRRAAFWIALYAVACCAGLLIREGDATGYVLILPCVLIAAGLMPRQEQERG